MQTRVALDRSRGLFFCPSSLVYGLESYLRTSGESNHHRQSVSDRVPRYQLHHEDDWTEAEGIFTTAWCSDACWQQSAHRRILQPAICSHTHQREQAYLHRRAPRLDGHVLCISSSRPTCVYQQSYKRIPSATCQHRNCLVRRQWCWRCLSTAVAKVPRPMMKPITYFFPLAADFALRLGPNNDRSGQIKCKHYETSWFHNSRQIQTHTNKNEAKQRRLAHLPARFAFRQQETQQNNTGPKPQPKRSFAVHRCHVALLPLRPSAHRSSAWRSSPRSQWCWHLDRRRKLFPPTDALCDLPCWNGAFVQLAERASTENGLGFFAATAMTLVCCIMKTSVPDSTKSSCSDRSELRQAVQAQPDDLRFSSHSTKSMEVKQQSSRSEFNGSAWVRPWQ